MYPRQWAPDKPAVIMADTEEVLTYAHFEDRSLWLANYFRKVVMSENSYLMFAFTKIGLMPDGDATALVAGRHRALRMVLNAEKVKADTALEWGLATEVAPADNYFEKAQEIAQRFAAGPTLSLGETEYAVTHAALAEPVAALERELEGQSRLQKSADFAEGIKARQEKRPTTFEGK